MRSTRIDGASAGVGENASLADPLDCPHQPLSSFDSQVVPTTMQAGVTYSVTIRMRNAGVTTWAAPDYVLVSQNPIMNITWGGNVVALSQSVGLERSLRLHFTSSLPPIPGVTIFSGRRVNMDTYLELRPKMSWSPCNESSWHAAA